MRQRQCGMLELGDAECHVATSEVSQAPADLGQLLTRPVEAKNVQVQKKMSLISFRREEPANME